MVSAITPAEILGQEIENIVVKVGEQGEVVYLKDVVTLDPKNENKPNVELGAKNYDVSSYLDKNESVTLAVFQLPGSNAIATANAMSFAVGK